MRFDGIMFIPMILFVGLAFLIGIARLSKGDISGIMGISIGIATAFIVLGLWCFNHEERCP